MDRAMIEVEHGALRPFERWTCLRKEEVEHSAGVTDEGAKFSASGCVSRNILSASSGSE